MSTWLPSWSWSPIESSTGGSEQIQCEQFDDLEDLKFLRILDENCTISGKRLVVITGRHMTIYPGLDLNRVSRYVLHKLSMIAGEAFIILYVHTEVSYMENCPGIYWLRNLILRLQSPLVDQLESFYVLHCNLSLWLSLSYWCPRSLWVKLQYLSRIELLEDILQGTLDLPEFVLEHDKLLEEQPLADYGIFTSKEYMRHAAGDSQAGGHLEYH